jgi:hypothetical protein
MKPKQLNEIKLYLNEITHLFTPPDFDPFAHQPVFVSGLEAAANEIKMANRRSEHRLVLYLPAETITPELEQTIRQALDHYCSYKLEESRREVTLLRWEGFEALQTGLIFMAVCLFISLYVSKQETIPEYLQTFVGQGLSVVGWVSMWKPIDIFLYQWWPHWQSRFVYDKIKRAELVIRPQ